MFHRRTIGMTLAAIVCSLWWRPAPAQAQGAREASNTAAQAEPSDVSEGEAEVTPDRFEWLVVAGDAGYRVLDLQRIEFERDQGTHLKLIPTQPGGFSPGVAVGVRLWLLSVMARADVTLLQDPGEVRDGELWTLGLESSLRFSQARLQPYVLVGIGYASLGSLHGVIDDARQAADANGIDGRVGLGVDYYVSEVLTLGVRGALDALLLAARASALDLTTPRRVDTLGEAEARLREADGSIAGIGYSAALTFGIHAF